MRKILLCVSIIVLALSVGCGGKSNPEAERAAVPAAEQWLELVDSGQYAESWEAAASFFRGAVPKDQWVQTMQSGRAPFGEKVSREFKSASYQTEMPGAPDGQYVVIQFKASFKNKRSLVETITPMLDTDGKWRVSGYYMK